MDRRPVRVRQQGTRLSFEGAPPDRISHYFALDLDLGAIARQINVDPILHQALRSHWGLRIIRQDPWECLSAFILSAFNNIVRLTGMLDHLSVRFGERINGDHCFPGPEVIARVRERTLRSCGLGYRAPYLKAAAQAVAGGQADLIRWGGLEDEALRERLLAIPGVGEKVVECVMLFGYGRAAAFPVDVWIGRAMRSWYFRGRKVTDRRIREFARKHFGLQCGWAQQYLFCHARVIGKRGNFSGRRAGGSASTGPFRPG